MLTLRESLRPAFLWALMLALPGCTLLGQQDSGTILGTIRDSQDAVVPGAEVTIQNVENGVAKTMHATSSGEYSMPFLVPGNYAVSAVAPGFKKTIRKGILLRVADQLVVDMKLEVGAVSESVTVDATAPIVDSASITLGQVIEERRIVDLPLNGRDPTSLAALAPGVTPPAAPLTAAQGGTIPMINGGNTLTSTVTVDGATDVNPRSTQYLLLYTPNVDAVAEFKVQTNSMSAEYGRTNGGVITMVTKSGTNQLHGTLYWFIRNSDVDANDFFSNRAGIALASLKRNQAGLTIGGPAVIPKVYNGRDKTFFFLDYEAFRENDSSPTILTVPTPAQRLGDFSQTFNAQGKLVQIFDPLNTIPNPNGVAGAVLRQQFPGNIIPQSRLNPVALNMEKYYPQPTTSAVTGNLPLSPSIPNLNDTFDLRLDQYVGEHHFFGRGTYQQPQVGSANYFGNIGASSNPPLLQRRRQAAIQDVYAVSPTLVLNFQYSISYMHGGRTAYSNGFDITQLGFPAYYAAAQEIKAVPVTSITGYTGIGNGAQNYSTQTAHLVGASATKVLSRHNLKVGLEYNVYYNNQLQNSSAEGTLSLSNAFTQGPDPNTASTTAGNAMATFLLGYAGGTIINQPATAFRSSYVGLYVQDDVKVTRNLTAFLGLRWDFDNPRTERYDRMSVLNLSAPSPINVPGYNLTGQMTYPTGRLTGTQLTNLGPRVGLAYKAPHDTVIRAGYGIFYGLTSDDATLTGAFADGFSATTSIISSLNSITPIVTLSNPYPNGVNQPLTHSQLTPGLDLGQATNSALLSLEVPQYQQWNFTIQKSLGSSVLLEAAYVGNKGSHVSISNINIDSIPAAEMTALGAGAQTLVANPFYGIITDPTSTLSLPTVARKQLLLPYPQYTSVSSEAPSLGSSTYHSLQAKVEKRFSKGFTFLAAYTMAKELTNATSAGIEDPTNLNNERSLATWDVFQRVVLSGIYELPFGKGKIIGNNWNSGLNAVFGGWQLNQITTFQGGFPLALTSTSGVRPNRIHPLAAMTGSTASRVLQYFDTSAFTLPAAFTYGNAPATEPDVRTPGIDNTDLSLSKNFRFKERVTTQLRFESFNTFNRVQFASPGTQLGTTSFGVITTQQNQPRKLQAAVKIIF